MMEDKFSERIPEQTLEVKKANDAYSKQKRKFTKYVLNYPYDEESCENIRTITIQILEYLGELTVDIFKLHNEIYDYYTLKHPRELGITLYNDRVKEIHRPYDLVKNRCYKLLEDLDDYKFKKGVNC